MRPIWKASTTHAYSTDDSCSLRFEFLYEQHVGDKKYVQSKVNWDVCLLGVNEVQNNLKDL
jgi:hypothetical protein